MVRKIKERSFSGRLSQEPEEYEKIHAAVSRKAASEGIVLLKNEEHLLPVRKGSRIALLEREPPGRSKEGPDPAM